MEFFGKAPGQPSHLGILPGAFNPLTVAHLALAHAALGTVDEVLFVLPRQFPHKPYHGASFAERLAMLQDALADEPRFSIGTGEGALFRELAAECRASYGPVPQLSFICGRDAAERIVNWNYGEPGAVERMLGEFSLLVAARGGEYAAPAALREAIRPLALAEEHESVSASEVRRRIAAGEAWEKLVPPAIREHARRIFGAK